MSFWALGPRRSENRFSFVDGAPAYGPNSATVRPISDVSHPPNASTWARSRRWVRSPPASSSPGNRQKRKLGPLAESRQPRSRTGAASIPEAPDMWQTTPAGWSAYRHTTHLAPKCCDGAGCGRRRYPQARGRPRTGLFRRLSPPASTPEWSPAHPPSRSRPPGKRGSPYFPNPPGQG